MEVNEEIERSICGYTDHAAAWKAKGVIYSAYLEMLELNATLIGLKESL